MSGVAEALRLEFPEATPAECIRFTRACQDGKKDADQVKEEAEQMLENYLDWRSCYGLDYKKKESDDDDNDDDDDGDDDANNNPNNGDSTAVNNNGENGNDNDEDDKNNKDDDAADWLYAVTKALEVEASMRKAKELEKKLAEESNNKDEEKTKFLANYDIDFSDSQKEGEGEAEGEGGEENGTTKYKDNIDGDDEVENQETEESNGKNETNNNSDPTIVHPKELYQMVYLHKKDGKKITDKKGKTILHVLPGRINRRRATGDTYGLAICFYLDRKFDRASEEKMTVMIDVRAGEGWPNPVAVMMVNFVRKVVRMLQSTYPERLEALYLYPIPRMSMNLWGAIKRVFRYEIMDKVVLFQGAAKRFSPLPKEPLEEFIDGDVLDFLEEFRIDTFIPIGTVSDN